MNTLEQILPMLQFTTGRRIMVYDRLEPIAHTYNDTTLVEHIGKARYHDRDTRALENHWSNRNSRSPYPQELIELDNTVDNVLTAIRDIAQAQAAGYSSEVPIVEQVDEFLTELYPYGVAAVTSLPFVDQVAAVEAMVDKMQNGLQSTVETLGLQAKLSQLSTLIAEYRDLVNEGSSVVNFTDVRAARSRGQLYLREIIAIIIGHYYNSEDPAHNQARDALLAPILEQLDELRRITRSRRNGASVPGSEDSPDSDNSPDPESPGGSDDPSAPALSNPSGAPVANIASPAADGGSAPPAALRSVE